MADIKNKKILTSLILVSIFFIILGIVLISKNKSKESVENSESNKNIIIENPVSSYAITSYVQVTSVPVSTSNSECKMSTYTSNVYKIAFEYPCHFSVSEDSYSITVTTNKALTYSGAPRVYIEIIKSEDAISSFISDKELSIKENPEEFPTIEVLGEQKDVIDTGFGEGGRGDDNCGYFGGEKDFRFNVNVSLNALITFNFSSKSCEGQPRSLVEYTPELSELEVARQLFRSLRSI